MNPVNWFEIPVADMARARRFYESVFGVALELYEVGPLHMAWFPMENNAPGAAGSLVQGEHHVPSGTGIIIYFSVEDIEGVLQRVARSGGRVLNPKMSIGEYGFIGHLADSEGNCIGLHSMK